MKRVSKLFKKFNLFICLLFVLNIILPIIGGGPIKVNASSSLARSSGLLVDPTRILDFDLSIVENIFTQFDFTNYIGQNDTIDSVSFKKAKESKFTEATAVDESKKIYKGKLLAIHGEEIEMNVDATISSNKCKLNFKMLYEDTDQKFSPTMAINGQNVECDLKSWAGAFPANDNVSLKIITGTSNVVAEEVTKKISDLKANKVVWSNKANSFNEDWGYVLVATRGGKTYRSKFYCAMNNNTKVFRNLDSKIVSASLKENGNIDLKISADRIATNAVVKLQGNGSWVTSSTIDVSKKTADFKDFNSRLNSNLTARVENGSNGTSEAIINLHRLDKFYKLVCNVMPVSLNNEGVIVQLDEYMREFLSPTANNNKIYVYEVGDNFQKTKIGEKVGNIGIGSYNEIKFTNNKILTKGKTYLVELTNGNKTVSSSFVYLPIEASHKNVEYTTANIDWVYPNGYVPVAGDKLEIFVRDRSTDVSFPATPKVSYTHSAKLNLLEKKSEVLTNLSPNTDYGIKVTLSNQNSKSNAITQLTTKTFTLKNFIDVEDTLYGTDFYKIAYPRNRKIKIKWDFEPTNMTFGEHDKVEVYIKPNSTSEFTNYPNNDKYTNPVFERYNGTSNVLSKLKEAEITIPSFKDKYHVDVIYTIGGKKIINRTPQGTDGEAAYNRRTVQVSNGSPGIEITDITQTTAKIKWQYDASFSKKNSQYEQYVPENGHIIKGELKKINSKNDTTSSGFTGNENDCVFYYVHGNGTNLLDTTEKVVEDLDPGQWYRLRVQHILQMPGFDSNYRTSENFYNFQTGSFSIKELKSEQQKDTDSRNVKLTWREEGVPVFDGETQDIKVYLKESTTSEYPEKPLEGIEIKAISQTLTEETGSGGSSNTESVSKPNRECIINIPKYNTVYSAKVEYTLKGGKKVFENVLVEAKGSISLSISDIKTTGAKITCNLPSQYVKKDTDKVKLTIIKTNDNLRQLPSNKDITINNNKAEETISSGISENDICSVTVDFYNDTNTKVSTATGSFKATDKFQIIDLNVSDVKSTTGKMTWDFTPPEKLNEATESTDKVEILIKHADSEKQSLSETTDDSLTDFTKIYTMTHKDDTSLFSSHESISESLTEVRSDEKKHSRHVDKEGPIDEFKELNLIDLKVNQEYEIKVKYDCETTLSDDGAVKEATFKFKTIADSFKATVFTSNQTTATYGWEYPEGYTIQDNDTVKIYVKDVTEGSKTEGDSYGDALLTLTHGSGDGKYDLNEVTAVDVSGLTPERKYKSKIEFTMSGGDSSNPHTISTEVDISTKSFAITSFAVDSYQEYDILVNWTIEPENMVFNPADKLEIFVKLADAENYPTEPSYKLTAQEDAEGKSINNTFSDYVLAETIGAPQKMKMVYTVGDRTYEKELEFTNAINPMISNVSSVDETRALIEVQVPDNYEFVNGDALLIYAKDEFSDGDVDDDYFLVFEGVQSDTLSIPDDMRMIELSYLLPEANYEVLVKLDLVDGEVDPVKLEFRTTALPITDIKLESLGYKDAVISWSYGKNYIDFYEDADYNYTDKLIIVQKESDGTPIPADLNAIKQLKNTEYLGENIRTVKDAKIEVEDPSKEYDVSVCYDLGGLLYMKNMKVSYLSVKAEEDSITSSGAKISWKYPTNVTFSDSDKTEVFVRKSDETSYPESASFTTNGSSTTSTNLESLEGGKEYVAKVQVIKEGLSMDPVEVTFTTKGAFGEETVIEEVPEDISGTVAEFSIPAELPVDTSGTIGLSMGDEAYQGFTVSFTDDGTGFKIEPTIPKKTYKNIEVEIPLSDGTTHKVVIPEFTTQPEDTAQDWLSNAYWFAFERFPDEEGYNYWYSHRMKPKTLNGEYFLRNLMFAEDEFTNRNLADKDLIAALYQIVVNREYDQGGLEFWIGIYNENLTNAEGNKKLAQEVLVDRMVHEPEFGKLCEKVGIFWTQEEQDAAGVVG